MFVYANKKVRCANPLAQRTFSTFPIEEPPRLHEDPKEKKFSSTVIIQSRALLIYAGIPYWRVGISLLLVNSLTRP